MTWKVFGLLLLWFGLNLRGFDPSEGRENYELARLVLEDHRLGFAAPLQETWWRNQLQGVNGTWYNIHDFGSGFAMLPFAALHRLASRVHPGLEAFHYVFMNLFSAFGSALALTGFYRLLTTLNVGVRRAFLVSLVLALTTQILPYSRDASDGLWVMACLTWTFAMAAEAAAKQRPGSAGWAGFWMGWMIITRPTCLLFVPAVAWLAAGAGGRRGKRLLYLLLGMVPFALWQLFYNQIRTGNPLIPPNALAGIGVPWAWEWSQSIPANLFSPACGLLFFNPILLIQIPAVREFWRRHGRVALSAAIVFTLHFLVHAAVGNWGSFSSWGPRYLVMVLPLAALPLAFLPDLRRHSLRWLAATIILLSFSIQALGTYVDSENLIDHHSNVNGQASVWSFADSEIALSAAEVPRIFRRWLGLEPVRDWPFLTPYRQESANYGSVWFSLGGKFGLDRRLGLALFLGGLAVFLFLARKMWRTTAWPD